jgi:hypothetical protein
MNDLENDLRQVFERRAGDMGTSTEAPKQVLRRGRRRQVATALGGAVAAIGAVAVVIGVGAALLRNPTNQVPASPVGTAPYGERTATIQGVTVTAPAGWTLIDDWPFSAVIPSGSQTCSFSATGVPVNPSGDETVASAVEPSSSCTGTVESLPAGIPILQLANFAMPLDQTVCGLMDQPPATVPDEGVAIYVAQGTDGSMLITQSHDDLVASCPDASAITSLDALGPGPAVGVLIAGPDASAADLSAAQTVMDQLANATATLSPPLTQAPGYVVAAGNDTGTPWRIEATRVFGGTQRAGAIEAIAFIQDASGNDHAYDVPEPVDSQLVAASGRSISDGSTLTWGTADADVSTLDVVADTGSWTATLVPWPTGLADPAGGTIPSGSIWWTVAPPIKSAISVTLVDGTTRLLSGNDTTPRSAEIPPADFPGNVLSFGQEDGIGYVFGETNGGRAALLIAVGQDDRSNPMSFSWGGLSAWPTNRPLTYASSNADGGAVLGTVPQGVAEVKVTTGDGQVRTARTFQDLRPEFGGVVGWFVVVPEPAAGAGYLEATVQYFDTKGNEAYPADHLP